MSTDVPRLLGLYLFAGPAALPPAQSCVLAAALAPARAPARARARSPRWIPTDLVPRAELGPMISLGPKVEYRSVISPHGAG